jgi:hypothetical protein
VFQEYFSQHPRLVILAVVGLVISVVAFAGVLLYALIGLRDRGKVEHLANLPLQPDPEPDESPLAGRMS